MRVTPSQSFSRPPSGAPPASAGFSTSLLIIMSLAVLPMLSHTVDSTHFDTTDLYLKRDFKLGV